VKFTNRCFIHQSIETITCPKF